VRRYVLRVPEPPRETEVSIRRNEDGRLARAAAAIRRWDAQPGLLAATRRARRRLPGDASYGDPISTAGSEAPHMLARQLAALSGERPSVMRELGFGALQLWQGLSEAQGRGYGDREVAIMFTDLVDFSEWALTAGDSAAVGLLRRVDEAVSAAVCAHDGEVVKRLGDGLMAVFADPPAALHAAHRASDDVARLALDGYRPALRVGVHLGRPRRLGGDYLGVDVNIAARVAEAAGGGEVLVSERLLGQVDAAQVGEARRRSLDAKGAPQGLAVYVVRPLG
jgi:adenylate cyclase